MASTTLTTSTTPAPSMHPHRASFSGGAATSLVPAPPLVAATNPSQSSSNAGHMNSSQIPNASQQSQPSSQQSFSMSQPSQIPTSVYRQYTDPPPKPVDDGIMSIYSVRIAQLILFVLAAQVLELTCENCRLHTRV